MAGRAPRTAFELLAGEDEGVVAADIPDHACRHSGRSVFTHALALGAGRAAEGLADPRLVLAWLMTLVGAPVALIGLLVPVREAGALAVRLVAAGAIRRLKRRKWAWAAAVAVQGLAALGIAAAALTLWGAAAGWTILGLVALMAVAGAVAAGSARDTLGKTVAPARRGIVARVAFALGAGVVVLFALALILEAGPRGALVIWAVMSAGGLSIVAAVLAASLPEAEGATEGGGGALGSAWARRGLLRSEAELRRVVLAGALTVPAALAPPYMVALVSVTPGRGLEVLGALVFAAALAGIVAAPLWARLAAASSRIALALAGAAAATALAATAVADAAGLLGAPGLMPALVFVVILAWHGARIGRATRLDAGLETEADADRRVLAAGAIGLVLLGGGLLGLLAEAVGLRAVIALLALLAVAAVPVALSLDEAEGRAARR